MISMDFVMYSMVTVDIPLPVVNCWLLQVLTHIVELMTDPFGNYLVQKLLDRCSEQQRSDVLKEVSVPCRRLRGGMQGAQGGGAHQAFWTGARSSSARMC